MEAPISLDNKHELCQTMSTGPKETPMRMHSQGQATNVMCGQSIVENGLPTTLPRPT